MPPTITSQDHGPDSRYPARMTGAIRATAPNMPTKTSSPRAAPVPELVTNGFALSGIGYAATTDSNVLSASDAPKPATRMPMPAGSAARSPRSIAIAMTTASSTGTMTIASGEELEREPEDQAHHDQGDQAGPPPRVTPPVPHVAGQQRPELGTGNGAQQARVQRRDGAVPLGRSRPGRLRAAGGGSGHGALQRRGERQHQQGDRDNRDRQAGNGHERTAGGNVVRGGERRGQRGPG